MRNATLRLLCPTRGHPEDAAALLDSFERTAGTDRAQLVFLIDDDDPTAGLYRGEIEIGPSTGDPTGPLNRAARASHTDIVGFIGDDSRFETPDWDKRVFEALATPGFAWGYDGHDVPWPSTVFVSIAIVDALGWLALPSLKRGFFDRVWIDLALRAQCEHILAIMVRHDNSKRSVAPEIIAADEQAYKQWLVGQGEADASIVREVVR